MNARNPESVEHVLARLQLENKKSDAEHEADGAAIAAAALNAARSRQAAPLAILIAVATLCKEAADRTLLEPETLSAAVEALLAAQIEEDEDG